MINKEKLRETMLALTEAELAQAHEDYEEFLRSAQLDRTESIDIDEHAQAKAAAELAAAFDDREQIAEEKLRTIQAIDFGPKDTVEPGAVVRFGKRFLVVAVSTAEFDCEGHRCIGISTGAPIFKALEGREQGEDAEFNGRALHLHEVF